MIRSFMAEVRAAEAAVVTPEGDDGGDGDASADPVAEDDPPFLAVGLSNKLCLGFLTVLTSVFLVG